MEQLRHNIDPHKHFFQELVRQHKNSGKFILMRMRHNGQQPVPHILTHIKGKNAFVDEKMASLTDTQVLFLIKFKSYGIYLILTEDQATL
jgi:hypothetical protein